MMDADDAWKLQLQQSVPRDLTAARTTKETIARDRGNWGSASARNDITITTTNERRHGPGAYPDRLFGQQRFARCALGRPRHIGGTHVSDGRQWGVGRMESVLDPGDQLERWPSMASVEANPNVDGCSHDDAGDACDGTWIAAGVLQRAGRKNIACKRRPTVTKK
jgi:hypothetical protein